MKKILITGTSGNVGSEVLKAFSDDARFSCRILLRKKHSNLRLAKKVAANVEVIWGDLQNLDDCKNFIVESDYVFHIAGIIPPQADHFPEETYKTNVGGTKNLLQAVQEKAPNAKFIYTASYAEYGARTHKNPWGRVGDPLIPPLFDNYAKTKLIAERTVISSPLTWCSLRLPGILYDNILSANISDAIMFHTPWNTPIEWSTAASVANILKELVETDCNNHLNPDFWKNIYNIGNGAAARVTGYETLDRGFALMGKSVKRFFKPNWNPLKNFHCLWLEDSSEITSHFDKPVELEGFDAFFNRIGKKLWYYKLGKPFAPIIRKLLIERLLTKENAPMQWIKSGDTARVNAFYGSMEKAKSMSERWEDFFLLCENKNPTDGSFLDYAALKDERTAKQYRLNPGYDEQKQTLSVADLQQAAAFRGGKCLSASMPENIHVPIEWECSCGHRFALSVYAVLKGGFWCPDCMASDGYFNECIKHPYYKQIFD